MRPELMIPFVGDATAPEMIAVRRQRPPSNDTRASSVRLLDLQKWLDPVKFSPRSRSAAKAQA